jgi:hypothetical protein
MGRSTSIPYGGESARAILFAWRWDNLDRFSLALELMLNEQERVRAAVALADWKLMQNWKLYNEALNPPAETIRSSNDFMTRRAIKGTDGVQALLREFWKEKV